MLHRIMRSRNNKQDLPQSIDQIKTDEKYVHLLKGLTDACTVETENLFKQNDKVYTQPLIFLLTRYLAGGNNLKPPYAEIETETFIRALVSGKAKTQELRVLCGQTKRFIKAKELLPRSLSFNDLIYLNSFLVSQKSKQGLRQGRIWVGNPKTDEHAFYTVPNEHMRHELDVFLRFLNDPSADLLGRIMVGCHYFYHLHPFKDGNGRIWRCLSWHLLSSHYGDLQSLLIVAYFKLINVHDLYMAQKAIREGQYSPFIGYWQKALKWSADSFLFMLHVFEGGHITSRSLDDQMKNILEFEYYLKAERR